MCVLIFWTALRGSQNSSVALSQVMNHGFCSMTRDKTPKSGVAHCKLSPSQESDNEQIRIKSMLICFYDTQGIVQKEFLPPGKLSIKLALGCCTTTMPHITWQFPSMNFWQKKAFLWFHSPPVHQISVPVTSLIPLGSKTT